MKEEKNSFCLVLMFCTWTGFACLVCKAAGTNTLSSVLNPFLPIPKKEGREEQRRMCSFSHYLQWYNLEKIMYVPWGISRVLEEGRQIPSRGRVTWWHFWSEDNKCISEYFTGISPSLCVLISHWVLFFSCHTHHYTLNSGKTKAKAPTFLTSQRDKVLSAELVTTVLEKGRNSMLLTESLWPRRVYLHLSLQEKKTAMQHPPLRVTWSTDSSRWMQDTLCASLEKWTLTMTPQPNTAPQRQLQTPAHWCLLPTVMKAGAGRHKEMRSGF